MTDLLSFRCLEWHHVTTGPRQGWIAVVKPFTELTEQEADGLFCGRVRIDMEEYEVRAVERFCVFHWRFLRFGIMVKGDPKNRWDLESSHA